MRVFIILYYSRLFCVYSFSLSSCRFSFFSSSFFFLSPLFFILFSFCFPFIFLPLFLSFLSLCCLLTIFLTLLFYLHSSLIPLPPSCAHCFLSLSFVFVQPSIRAFVWTNKPPHLQPVTQESTNDNPHGHGLCHDWRVPALLCHAPAGITRLLRRFGGQIGRAQPSPRPCRLHCHASTTGQSVGMAW